MVEMDRELLRVILTADGNLRVEPAANWAELEPGLSERLRRAVLAAVEESMTNPNPEIFIVPVGGIH
jgi:hypothetical protein